MARSGEELHGPGVEIALHKKAMLQLRSASDAQTGGNQLVGTCTFDALCIGSGNKVPACARVPPQACAAFRCGWHALVIGDALSIAVVRNRREGAVKLLSCVIPQH